MFITPRLLFDKGACHAQYLLFRRLFPLGVEVTEELCVAHARDFCWDWAGTLLLTGEDRKSFEAAWEAAEETLLRALMALPDEPGDIETYWLATEQLKLDQAMSLAAAFGRAATKPGRAD